MERPVDNNEGGRRAAMIFGSMCFLGLVVAIATHFLGHQTIKYVASFFSISNGVATGFTLGLFW